MSQPPIQPHNPAPYATDAPAYGTPPTYGAPAYGTPPSHGAPSAHGAPPANAAPAYGMPPAYEAPAYGTPPSHGAPSAYSTPPANGAPTYGTSPSYGAPPAYGSPTHGAPAYGAPTHGALSHGASAHGAPPANGAPAFGTPHGAPAYGTPANGAPTYGAPGYGGQPPAHGLPAGYQAAAQPGQAAVLACRFCGSVPAVQTKFRGHRGMIVLMQFLSTEGPFCRDCGLGVFRHMTSRTLVQGWYGYASLVIAPITVLVNLTRRGKVARLAAPQPNPYAASNPPMDPGPRLLQRPMTWIGLLIPVALVALIAIAASSS